MAQSNRRADVPDGVNTAHLVSWVRSSSNKFAANQRHAALQMLAMPLGIAVLCASPDADFDKLISSTNF
jgi:hypothetical protein